MNPLALTGKPTMLTLRSCPAGCETAQDCTTENEKGRLMHDLSRRDMYTSKFAIHLFLSSIYILLMGAAYNESWSEDRLAAGLNAHT